MADVPQTLEFSYGETNYTIRLYKEESLRYQLVPEDGSAVTIDQEVIDAAQNVLDQNAPDGMTLTLHRVSGANGDDRIEFIQEGAVFAKGGDDIIDAYADRCTKQIHTYAGAGDDTTVLRFQAIPAGGDHAHGHHARGDDDGSRVRGNDIFDFRDLDNVRGVVVGRIEDFEATRDTIEIEGVAISLAGGFASGKVKGHSWRVVEYNGDLGDDTSQGGPQQWLLIKTAEGGTVFYALEGARVDIDGTGQEAHFIKSLPNFAALKTVSFADPVNYVPLDKNGNEYVQDDGGVFINDDDEAYDGHDKNKDVTTVIAGTEVGDVISAGLNSDTVQALGGNDKVWGGTGHDTIDAGAGNDTVWGGRGNDTLYGEDGNDTLYGEDGNDILSGGSGNDTLAGGAGDDSLSGGANIDTVDYGSDGGTAGVTVDVAAGTAIDSHGDTDTLSGFEVIIGTAQADTLSGGSVDETLSGGDGDDFVQGDGGNDRVGGGDGDDTVWGGSGNDTIYGGIGNDRLRGGADDDAIYGGGGNDTIQGDTGNNWLEGGDGNDKLYGWTGNDSLFGGNGDDELYDFEGDDVLAGGGGDDKLVGGDGDDLIYTGTSDGQTFGVDEARGGAGNDTLIGSNGTDTLYGDEGSDRLNGGDDLDTADIDYLYGGAGDDLLESGQTDAVRAGFQDRGDRLYGEEGNDTLIGGLADDTLDGGSGNDTLDGGAGDDVLIGSAGADVFVLSSGNDTIVDFNAAEGDTLQGVDAFMPAGRWTADSFMKTFVSYGADGTVLQLADGSSITFLGDVDMSAVVAQLQLATETTVVEGEGTPLGDAENGFDTQYTIEVGDSVTGSLGFFGDIDWFRIDLEEGQLYDFAQSGVGMDISIHSGSGARVAGNNDSGFGGDFQLYFAPQESGTYYIEIEGDLRVSSGSYDMSVTVAAPDSINSIAGHLSDDYWNSLPYTEEVRSGPRQFETGPNGEIYYDSASLLALPLEQFELAILAMTAWESYADVVFVGITAEDENPEAGIAIELEFQNTGPGAFTNFTFVDEDPDTTPGLEIIDLATVNVGQDVIDEHGARLDSFSYLMYLYTLGRALGLGNAGFYDDRNGDPIESTTGFGYSTYFYNDSWQTSVMSAFSQTDNLFIDATEATSVSPMMADIMAIQSIYGARQTSNDGDTIYGANSTASGYGGSLSFMMRGGFNPPFYGGPVAMTLYDTGGNDTIDASFSDADQTIRLTGGSFSDIGGYTGNVAIYLDTVIENAIGGGGNDTLLGNAVGNRLEGGAGDDVIDGGGGTDTAVYAIGSTEAEVTVDEDGVFEVVSSLGTDTLANIEFVAFADKTVRIEELARFERVGGDRSDIIFGFDLGDSISGLGGDDELFGLAGDDIISGGNGADLIEGGRGNDILFGDAGDDTIYGDAGQDSLNGGTGDDLLTGGAGADVFVFLAETETGSDRILDFSIADADRIALDSTLWGRANLTTEEVIDQYAVVVGSSTVFVFDGGQSVTIDGVANPMSLVDHIDII
jgi:Ca2+-binding RTX toxin-like protein